MTQYKTILPLELIVLTLVFIIIPTIIAVILRRSLYGYLINSANKVSRLLTNEVRGRQPAIVDRLETRFRHASQQLEQVNTIALIDGLYSQERLTFLGISLRCEQWDYFCQALPNLLLAFGLLGTFIGISFNLYNLSQTINFEQNVTDVNNLIAQLQQPLQNMGIAFSTSLFAILCSSILIVVNLRCNTNFAKFLLISSLEDYLDNIFKIKIDGYSRLDKAVDRMVKQQEEFLNRFHEKVGQVLETTIGDAANKMVLANQGFQNNVDSMTARFNDISSSIAVSTDSFQASAFSFKEQMQTVTKIVPEFETAASKIKSGSNLYLLGAKKIEESKFSENLEQLTADLTTTQKSFSQSTALLGDRVHEISETHQQAADLAKQIYTQLQTASSKLQDSAVGFAEAAETFKQSNFADKLTTATKELTTIPKQFNDSTQILHQSADALSTAINNINASTHQTNNLIEKVNNLNQNSTKLLKINAERTQQEIDSFSQLSSDFQKVISTLEKHREQINVSMADFGEKILTSFEQQTNNNVRELQHLNTEIKQNKIETAKFIDFLEKYRGDFSSLQPKLINTVNTINKQRENFYANFNYVNNNNVRQLQKIIEQITNLISKSEQQGKQISSNLNGIGLNSDRIIMQLNTIDQDISRLNAATLQQKQQANSQFNNSINSANQQIKNITKKFDNLL